jgi:hypothetical protein
VKKIAQHSSKSNEYYTPPEVLDVVRKTWLRSSGIGHIDLDPASCAIANKKLVQASRYYTLEANEDGLSLPWEATRVFVNPPGGFVPGTKRSQTQAFWFKACDEFLSGRAHEIFFLGFTLEILRLSQDRKDTSVLQFPFCIPRERLCFYKLALPSGILIPEEQPTHANVLIFLTRSFNAAKWFADIGRYVLGDVIIPNELPAMR